MVIRKRLELSLSFKFLCCLMVPGLRKDIQHHIRQLYSHHQEEIGEDGD